MSINRFILNKENYYPNVIRFSNNKKNKKNKAVIYNIIIDKNTFISESIEYYGYKIIYINEAVKVAQESDNNE